MISVKNDIRAAIGKIKAAEDVLIVCHTRADGDAIGSSLALARICRMLGTSARVLVPGGVPERLRFLVGDEDIVTGATPASLNISVDVASLAQLGEAGELGDFIDIKIDHHAVGDGIGARCRLDITDKTAAAAGELVYLFALEAGDRSERTATLLFAAVASDTGSFKYSNTTPATFECARNLCEWGARTAEVSDKLFDTRSYREALAVSHVYGEMRWLCGGKILAVLITNDKKRQIGTLDEDYGEASSLLRCIEGTELAFAVKQDDADPTHFKCSMRSRSTVDCAALCARFGGGGHMRAAGCTVYADSPEEAFERVARAAMEETE